MIGSGAGTPAAPEGSGSVQALGQAAVGGARWLTFSRVANRAQAFVGSLTLGREAPGARLRPALHFAHSADSRSRPQRPSRHIRDTGPDGVRERRAPLTGVRAPLC
jgi:hypothetical protein